MRVSTAAAYQVVGRGDGMDVAGEVQVEIFHGDHLAVTAASSAALDPKGWTLAGLADGGEHPFTKMCTQGLAQTDRGGRLSLHRGVWA
jgi:hypothetical protein